MTKHSTSCVDSAPQASQSKDDFFRRTSTVFVGARKHQHYRSNQHELVAKFAVSEGDDLAVVTLLESDYRFIAEESLSCSQLIAAASSFAVSVIAIDLTDIHLGAAFLGTLVSLASGLACVGKRLVTFGDGIGLMRIANLDQFIPTFDSFDDLLIRNRFGAHEKR